MNKGSKAILDPRSFSSDKQRDLYAYWLKMKGDMLIPHRKNLDPADIPHLLSAMWMAYVIGNGQDKFTFRVRLFGTDLVRAFQMEGTNMKLEDFSFTADIVERLSNLVRTKQPYYHECEHPVESDDIKFYSTLTLPLSSDNENIDIIISALHFYS